VHRARLVYADSPSLRAPAPPPVFVCSRARHMMRQVGGGHTLAFGMMTVSMDRNIGMWEVNIGGGGGEGAAVGVGCSLVQMLPTLGGYPYDMECNGM
jgi:hypothetical protein